MYTCKTAKVIVDFIANIMFFIIIEKNLSYVKC